jgi:hypothetical protein
VHKQHAQDPAYRLRCRKSCTAQACSTSNTSTLSHVCHCCTQRNQQQQRTQVPQQRRLI